MNKRVYRKNVPYLKDLVTNKSQCSKPNTVWEIDLFYFPKKVKNYNFKQQIYLAIADKYSRYCIKVVNVTKQQKTKHFINIVGNAIEESIYKPIIIHTDRGTQFSSRLWFEFSKIIKQKHNIAFSMSKTKAYNTFSMNYFVKNLRWAYLYNINLSNITDINIIDEIVFNAIKTYKTKEKPIFSNQHTPESIYFNPKFNNVYPILSENYVIPHTPNQNYIDLVKLNFNEINFKELILNQNINSKLTFIKDSYNITITKRFNKKQKKITKKKRDIIAYKEFFDIINANKYFLINNQGYIRESNTKVFLQLKIILILLYLTGCRISELTALTFYDLEKTLKTTSLGIWSHKDSTSRIIPIKNKILLNKLSENYYNLKEYCIKNNIIYNYYENYIFFKVIKINNIPIAKNMSRSSTIKDLVNVVLKYYILTKYPDKVWSTHSFRYTLINKLIASVGIEKTSKFIGHKHINTTQLYIKNLTNTKMLNELATYI